MDVALRKLSKETKTRALLLPAHPQQSPSQAGTPSPCRSQLAPSQVPPPFPLPTASLARAPQAQTGPCQHRPPRTLPSAGSVRCPCSPEQGALRSRGQNPTSSPAIRTCAVHGYRERKMLGAGPRPGGGASGAQQTGSGRGGDAVCLGAAPLPSSPRPQCPSLTLPTEGNPMRATRASPDFMTSKPSPLDEADLEGSRS